MTRHSGPDHPLPGEGKPRHDPDEVLWTGPDGSTEQ